MKKALKITAVLAFMLTTVVSIAKEVKTNPNQVSEVKPLVLNLTADKIIKPTFRTKGKMVYMNHLNLDRKKVEVKVYDAFRNVVYETSFNNEVIIEKAFNFENVNEGRYIVIIKDGVNTFYENLLVK
mgnify:CR=1 FL=1|tara:strand:+ start:877 stop:1257 length:381 start_codon:yes stop_codon:yes gene_type:complete